MRQNNQNSQNEPGMSFGINKACRARSGPDMAATGSREPDRGRFELTVGRQAPGESPRLERRQPWLPTRLKRSRDSRCLGRAREGRKGPPLPTRSKRGQRLSPFATPVRQNNQNSQNEPGMSFGINQIVNRGGEEGACPLKNKDLLTMTAPYCESRAEKRNRKSDGP